MQKPRPQRWFIDDEENIRWAVRGSSWRRPPGSGDPVPERVEFTANGALISTANTLGIDPVEMTTDEMLLLLGAAKREAGWRAGPQLPLIEDTMGPARRAQHQIRLRRLQGS